MTTKRTRLGCTVTTTFTETKAPVCGFPAGTPIEHVILECTGRFELKIARPESGKVWDR